jgi:hypothetical protein
MRGGTSCLAAVGIQQVLKDLAMAAKSDGSSFANAGLSRWWERSYFIFVGCVVLLGGLLRLNRYALNRSLWLDEALLALNILERRPLELIGPLDYGQAAPMGFTVATKLLTMAMGAAEPALRLIPLLSGLASLVLFYLVAVRWLPRWPALLTLALFAVSDSLADYSAQFKQYSLDVAVTLILLLAALWFSEAPRRNRALVFAAVGMIAVWFSHPAAIVLAGIGFSLLYLALRRRATSEVVQLAVVATCWLMSFAITYLLVLRSDIRSASLVGHWEFHDGFLPSPASGLAGLEKGLTILLRAFEDPLGFGLYSGVVFLYAVGVLEVLRKGGTRLFLVAPPLVAVALSGFRLYPYAGRLLLFAVPFFLLTVALGLGRVGEALRGPRRLDGILAIGLVVFVVFEPFRYGLARGLRPRELEETRPLVALLTDRYRPGDRIAVYYAAQYAYRYYSELLGFHATTMAVIRPEEEAMGRTCREVDDLRGAGRVWVLFSHKMVGPQGPEEPLLLGCLDRAGARLEEFKETGASLYLYDLAADAAPVSPAN